MKADGRHLFGSSSPTTGILEPLQVSLAYKLGRMFGRKKYADDRKTSVPDSKDADDTMQGGILARGCRVAELLARGDTGIGVLDSQHQMIIVDGMCFQTDPYGTVSEADACLQAPFAFVSTLEQAADIEIGSVDSLEELAGKMNALIAGLNPQGMYLVHLHGWIEEIRLQYLLQNPVQTGSPAALRLPESLQEHDHLSRLTGTILGFYAPASKAAKTQDGWSFRFLSDDHTRSGLVCSVQADLPVAELEVPACIIQLDGCMETDSFAGTKALMPEYA